jgi:hypothetical protein
MQANDASLQAGRLNRFGQLGWGGGLWHGGWLPISIMDRLDKIIVHAKALQATKVSACQQLN